MSDIEKFMIYVFSYNRGQFLLNCLKSIEQSAKPLGVCIIDDNSTDSETLEVLGDFSSKYCVIKNDRTEGYEIKTGGLAGCMNLAMVHAANNNVQFAIFIQDDMQFTRALTECDLASIVEYFQVIPNSIQISTSFVRKLSADSFLHDYDVNKNASAYIRNKETERGKSNFSATGVFFVQRFYEFFKIFEAGEAVNSSRAIALGLTCGRAIYPFMCWLPYPVSYRGKKRNVKHQFFEYFGRSGFYPIGMMSAPATEAFVHRDPSVIPVMETFLSSPDCPRQDIWSTGGGEYNFVCFGGYLARLYIGLRKLKQSIRGLLR